MSVLIRVNESSERAIYAQIADSVREDIVNGRIGSGSALPPAREVALGIGVNVHTVLRAYQLLRDEGLVDLKRRRGAVVTQAAIAIVDLRLEVQSLVARAATLGVSADALAALIAGAGAGAGAAAGAPASPATAQTTQTRGGTAV